MGSQGISSERDWHLLQAQAEIYIVAKQHEKALNCFLQVKCTGGTGGDGATNNHNNHNNSSNQNSSSQEEYRHVFELIEKEGSNIIIIIIINMSREVALISFSFSLTLTITTSLSL